MLTPLQLQDMVDRETIQDADDIEALLLTVTDHYTTLWEAFADGTDREVVTARALITISTGGVPDGMTAREVALIALSRCYTLEDVQVGLTTFDPTTAGPPESEKFVADKVLQERPVTKGGNDAAID